MLNVSTEMVILESNTHTVSIVNCGETPQESSIAMIKAPVITGFDFVMIEVNKCNLAMATQIQQTKDKLKQKLTMTNLREVHPYGPCLSAPLPCDLRLSYEYFQCNDQKTGFQIQTRIPLDFGLHKLTKEKE